jgi:hypothetical protein
MTQRVMWGSALLIALLCLASPARADKETIFLDFQAAGSCPDRARFIERVHTFTTKVEVVTDEALPRRRFGIRVTRDARAVHGELTIDNRGMKTTRSVSGTTCDEVVSALALATALAVDPEALGELTPEPPPEEIVLAEPPPPELKPQPPKAPLPMPRPKPSPRPKPKPLRELPNALDFSLGARLSDAIAPFPKIEAAAELGTTYFAPLDLHVGFAFGPAQHDSQAEFADLVGWLGTGYRLLDLEPVSVWAQTAFELGHVQAVGRGVSPTHRVDKLWAAVDVGLSVRLEAAGPLFFQVIASGRAPLSLQRYVVSENTGKLRELHQVEQLGYLLGLSVGVHFL